MDISKYFIVRLAINHSFISYTSSVLNPKACYRGITMAVVDNLTKTVIRVSNYDTYDKDSTAFERDLLTIRTGDIAILLTHDEPATKLSAVSRLLLHELGKFLLLTI